ncbi:MAG: HlyD family efflux transporter periplasmic adaptor subunit [Bacteroidales bacterium]|nr:HlyD family efflux transporter periplasmic adaptor subunit [Bacteroidales bacterium]MBN2749793.1 HlyD family efflux transporter periplasmic adaptor subunit [Bacteroidales bacterium]
MEEKIDIRSDEITEILGTPPKWIVRWGISVVFIVVTVIIVGSAFFRYPDIVTAQAIITTENPPSTVIAKSNGKPAAILKKEGVMVQKGDTLGVIENPANHNDVFTLGQLVAVLQSSSTQQCDSILQEFNQQDRVLGDIQPSYNAFINATSELNLFQQQQYHRQKIEALEGELREYRNYYDRLWSQRNLTLKDLNLSQKQFARDSSLFKKGVISASDYEKAQSILLSKKQAMENARINLSNAAITIEKLKQAVADTKLEYESQLKKSKQQWENTKQQLASSLSAWNQSYLLLAQSAGILSYMNVWSNLQEVKTGDAVFAITPNEQGATIVRLSIPFEGAGKVKAKQRVTIKVNGYPYMEFGVVEGEVASISSGYTEKGYPALATLPLGATTSYGTTLSLDRELIGTAEIATEELTLLQRLLSPVRHLLTNSTVRKR